MAFETSQLARISRALWCCHKHQRYLAVCFRGHIAKKNSTPYHLRGWCQAERQWTLHLPLCPDTFRYMQEMCFSRKARCFRNCCNAIEWSLLIPCAWSKLTTTDRKSQKSPGKGMFGRLLWNWKHCLQVQCDIALKILHVSPVKCKPLSCHCLRWFCYY